MAQIDYLAAIDCAFNNAKTPELAFSVTCALAQRLGFEHVIHAPVHNHPDASKNWSATTYPSAWQEIYIAEGYLSRNPVRTQALQSALPFLWSDLKASLPKNDRILFDICQEHGMQEGCVIPVHGPWGQAIAIGFASQHKDAHAAPHALLCLNILAHKLHQIFDHDLALPPEKQLTRREKQVLQLVATGLANPEIADYLNISDNSVEWHLKNINAKLGVRNRTAAVVQALQSGQLSL